MLSKIAAIIDRGGGWRVVVTDGDLNAHVGPGERLVVLPNTVQEPVPFEDHPKLVKMVEDYLKLVA